jgi:hypothetical protein
MIIKKAQYNFIDVFDETQNGWEGHTRVQVKKHPGKPIKVYYHSGKPLSSIKYVEISKTI